LVGGAAGIRFEGHHNVEAVRVATWRPIIGLVKKELQSSPVFITPETEDVRRLAESGADIVAFDAMLRPRPISVRELVTAIPAKGKLAMADVATFEDAQAAADAGADILGTILFGYTPGPAPSEPDIELVSRCAALGVPVLAEGRYRTPDQARSAIEAGAHAVVVGSAITCPEQVTSWFVDAMKAARRTPSSPQPTLAVDIGGTKTLVALVAGDEIVESRRIATQKTRGPDVWLNDIAQLAADWRGSFEMAGVAATGAVKGGRWWSLDPAVLPIPPGFPLIERLSDRLNANVIALNDAQAAAWGAYRLGAGKASDMVFLTISTGIGGGIVQRGRLVTGRNGLSRLVGQMQIPVDGGYRPLEDIASAVALEREAARRGHRTNGSEIVSAAGAGEAWAEEIIETSIDRLALSLGSIQITIDPDCFVIGEAWGFLAISTASGDDLPRSTKGCAPMSGWRPSAQTRDCSGLPSSPDRNKQSWRMDHEPFFASSLRRYRFPFACFHRSGSRRRYRARLAGRARGNRLAPRGRSLQRQAGRFRHGQDQAHLLQPRGLLRQASGGPCGGVEGL
jgi:N-acetylmannosamine-6-phosphate 2-epimerase/N-acetylmannosamine kinase